MVNIFQTVVLAVVQGLTEFLPISSSAHLILVPQVADWPDQGTFFDVAVHIGTLFAVVIYFRKTIFELFKAWLQSIFYQKRSTESRLAWQLLLTTLPAVFIGLTCHNIIESTLRSPIVIGFSTVFFAVLLFFSDKLFALNRTEYTLSYKDAFLIGIAQALALIPGTSRSGITMTAGLSLGLSRESAARFSFLMSIPIILMAGVYEGGQYIRSAQTIPFATIFLAMGISAVSAFLCIHFFLKLINKIGMLPFVLYRFLLGGFIFLLFV